MPLPHLAVPPLTPPTWHLSDRLRKIRREVAFMDQASFAELLGLTRVAYATYETGRHKPRQVDDLARRIEHVTGVPAWWVAGFNPPVASAVAGQNVTPITAGKATSKGSLSTTADEAINSNCYTSPDLTLAGYPWSALDSSSAADGCSDSSEWLRAS